MEVSFTFPPMEVLVEIFYLAGEEKAMREISKEYLRGSEGVFKKLFLEYQANPILQPLTEAAKMRFSKEKEEVSHFKLIRYIYQTTIQEAKRAKFFIPDNIKTKIAVKSLSRLVSQIDFIRVKAFVSFINKVSDSIKDSDLAKFLDSIKTQSIRHQEKEIRKWIKENTHFYAELSALKELDLSYLGLQEISAEIGLCKGLVRFRAENNKIRKLPPEISKCEQLVYLSLINNQISELSDVLKQCKNLKVINLIGNPVDKEKINASLGSKAMMF